MREDIAQDTFHLAQRQGTIDDVAALLGGRHGREHRDELARDVPEVPAVEDRARNPRRHEEPEVTARDEAGVVAARRPPQILELGEQRLRTGLNYSFGTKKYCHQIRKFQGIILSFFLQFYFSAILRILNKF
jgi:hypothetical protein